MMRLICAYLTSITLTTIFAEDRPAPDRSAVMGAASKMLAAPFGTFQNRPGLYSVTLSPFGEDKTEDSLALAEAIRIQQHNAKPPKSLYQHMLGAIASPDDDKNRSGHNPTSSATIIAATTNLDWVQELDWFHRRSLTMAFAERETAKDIQKSYHTRPVPLLMRRLLIDARRWTWTEIFPVIEDTAQRRAQAGMPYIAPADPMHPTNDAWRYSRWPEGWLPGSPFDIPDANNAARYGFNINAEPHGWDGIMAMRQIALGNIMENNGYVILFVWPHRDQQSHPDYRAGIDDPLNNHPPEQTSNAQAFNPQQMLTAWRVEAYDENGNAEYARTPTNINIHTRYSTGGYANQNNRDGILIAGGTMPLGVYRFDWTYNEGAIISVGPVMIGRGRIVGLATTCDDPPLAAAQPVTITKSISKPPPEVGSKADHIPLVASGTRLADDIYLVVTATQRNTPNETSTAICATRQPALSLDTLAERLAIAPEELRSDAWSMTVTQHSLIDRQIDEPAYQLITPFSTPPASTPKITDPPNQPGK